MAKSGKVAIVTGSATGLGAACAVDLAGRGWNVAINYTKSKKEADETYAEGQGQGRRGDPGAGRHGPGCRLQEARRRDAEEVGPHRRPGQQRRHHQVPEPGRPRRRDARGLRPHPAGQRHRPLHDEPRRLSDDEEAVGGQAGARLDRQHLLDRGRHGRRHARSPMPLQGRAQHADLSLARWFGAGGAGQHGVPGLHPDALAAGRHSARRTTTSCATRRSRPRRCARPARPSRWPRR